VVDRMRRLSKLEAEIGKTAALWSVVRDLHPLMRQKVVDEAAGYTNHTRPPKLGDLRGLDAGVRWLMQNDWDTAYEVEFDLDILRGSGQGYDISAFCVEKEGGSIEEDRQAAKERLRRIKQLPPRRWHEVYAHDEDVA
jgi:hypothetical protein